MLETIVSVLKANYELNLQLEGDRINIAEQIIFALVEGGFIPGDQVPIPIHVPDSSYFEMDIVDDPESYLDATDILFTQEDIDRITSDDN